MWTVFLIATFLVQVTFLNMLIAVMGNTFGMVLEKTSEAAMREKIGILNDYRWVNRFLKLDKAF